MEVSIQSIRFVSPAVAMEDGTTTVTHRAGEPAEHSRYTVVHVKHDGKWLMAIAVICPTRSPRRRTNSRSSIGLWASGWTKARMPSSARRIAGPITVASCSANSQFRSAEGRP